MIRSIAAMSVLLFAPGVALAQIHQPFTTPVTAEKIRISIDDAVMYLRARQAADGSIQEQSRRGGSTGLAALTMLAAGIHPATDDQLKKAIDFLASFDPNDTYVRAIRTNVWEYALRKVPYDQRIRGLLKKDYEWLVTALGDAEGWRYQMKSAPDWDNSCTQYGVLGIWAAARADIEVPDKVWIAMSKHFRGCQNSDGGWGYQRGSSTANMATAGLASMFLVFDMYHGKRFYSADNPRTFTEGEAAEVLKSIDRGMEWLGKAPGSGGYYLYGIERTGVAGGRKYIGGNDWFARGALEVLQGQRADGSIPGSYGQAINTSFCTLFLVYGGAPVAIEKLEWGETRDWNLNPRDLANLSKYLWSAYERPLNWQTVSIKADAESFEAPILFISGSLAARFSEEEVLKLREYILRGGTILAEPSDHSEAFVDSMEKLVRQMFPEKDFPGYELKTLPADHGIYTVIKQDWQKRPRLRGVSDGSRTFLILSDEYLSADWQVNRTKADAFKLATNLLFYATDLGELRGKFSSILPNTPAAGPRETPIRIARLKYDSGKQSPRDWDAAAVCWRKYAPYAKHITGCELKEDPPVTLAKDELDGIRLLHITGRGAPKLSDEERAALKQFVKDGGTVLVDAYAGSAEFAAGAKAELEEVFGQLKPLPADHLLAEGRFDGGEDLSSGIRFKLPARQMLRRRGEDSRGQKLLVAFEGKRPAVIYSEFDLASAMAGINNFRAPGYKPGSARKIVGNLLAYVMAD